MDKYLEIEVDIGANTRGIDNDMRRSRPERITESSHTTVDQKVDRGRLAGENLWREEVWAKGRLDGRATHATNL